MTQWLHFRFLAGVMLAMALTISSCVPEPVSANETLVVKRPPLRYRVNPAPLRIKVTVFAVPLRDIERVCSIVAHSHGDFCTQLPTVFWRTTWNPCVIYIPNEYTGAARKIMLRHARAECYGWWHF